jgi:FkbM family methyltransferase
MDTFGISFRSVIDQHVCRDMFRLGDWRPPLDTEPETILDLGAYAGYSTFCLAMAYPDADICAVEPDPGNYDMLVENTRALNVRTWNVAVGGSPGRAGLESKVAENQRWLVAGNEIRVVTLPQVITHFWGKRHVVDYVKMDIEGAERDVLAKGRAWKLRVRMLKVELHREEGNYLVPEDDTDNAFWTLRNLGYLVCRDDRRPDTLIARHA